MLSEQDKREMLADAKSLKRQKSFRQTQKAQADRTVSGVDYFAFLNEMQLIFPGKRPLNDKVRGNDFRL